MANEYGLFFNSVDGDRIYDADSFAEWLQPFFLNGVFEGSFTQSTNNDMSVTISSGIAYINGKLRTFDKATTIDLEPANGAYPRIDTIVVERNDTDRQFTIKAVTGAYAGTSPSATDPVRTNNIYQLVICEIAVAAGATVIKAGNITDKRTDKNVCGWVSHAIQTPDFQSWYNLNQSTFEDWFENVKETLDSDVAGNLLNLINETNTRIDNLSSDSVKLSEDNDTDDSIKFGIDESGNYGYIKKGEEAVTPFKSQADIDAARSAGEEAGIASVTLSRSGRTVTASNGQTAEVPYATATTNTTVSSGVVTCNPTAANTSQATFNVGDGYVTSIVVNTGNVYNAGKSAVTLSTSGRTVTASNSKSASVAYCAKASSGTNYESVAVSSGAVTITSTGATGTISYPLTAGWCTSPIKVNQTNAYNAGKAAATFAKYGSEFTLTCNKTKGNTSVTTTKTATVPSGSVLWKDIIPVAVKQTGTSDYGYILNVALSYSISGTTFTAKAVGTWPSSMSDEEKSEITSKNTITIQLYKKS